MKTLVACLLTAVLAGSISAQDPGSAKPPSRAVIGGIVTRDPDGQPVKKAVIELIAEDQSEGGDYTAVTTAEGSFRVENILPGRYHLFVERPGFLDSGKSRSRAEGRILTLTAGQEVKDLHIRLEAAAVVRGRVTDEDGDPMPNAEVSVLRQTFESGHSHWEQVGSERTNDLGEYRIANLAAGNIYVSVSPPPDFKSLIEASGKGEPHGADKASTSYQTTYYPGTADRSQAMPVPLHAGDDFPANFSLTPSPALSIRGAVVNLPPRTSATIMLQAHDFGLVMNGAEMHKDGSFVIHDVSPGNYTIFATVDGAAVPMMARQSVLVGSNNVEGVRLSPQPGATIRGHLRLEGKGNFDPQKILLGLESTDGEQEDGQLTIRESFANITRVASDGSFQWVDVPAGDYYVQIEREGNSNDDWFVRSALSGGHDINESGFAVNGGTMMLDLAVSANGGIVDGVVVDSKGQPVANAVVVAVPEARMRGRMDRYGKTVSDQGGRFSLRGVRPGDYTLFAWENVDGDAYYNPEFLKSYEGQGNALRVGERERKNMQLQAIADSEQAPGEP